MSKRNISFTKPPEPSFIKKMKESIGYQEPDTIETKMKMADYDPNDDVDRDDEKPVIVVLKSGDISEEDLKKVEEQAEENKKIVFAKPDKKTAEEKNSLDFSSKKKKDLQQRIDSEKEKTKKIYSNKFQRLLGIVRLKNQALSVNSPTSKISKIRPTTNRKYFSAAGFGVWKYEMEALLLKLVKKQRHLWDSNHELYSKKNIKRQSYEIMANYMRSRWPEHGNMFTPDALISKFGNLRTYYYREAKKIKVINSQLGSNDFKPRWVHFSTMNSFLNYEFSTTQTSSDLDLLEISSPDIRELQSIAEMPSIRIDTIQSLHPCDNPCDTEQEDGMEDTFEEKDLMVTISRAEDDADDFSPLKNATENFSQLSNVTVLTQSKPIEDFSYLNGAITDFSESENEAEDSPQSNGETEDFSQYKQVHSSESTNNRSKEIEIKRGNKSANVDSQKEAASPATIYE